MSLRLAACTAPVLAMGAALVLAGCSRPPAPPAPRVNPFTAASTLPLQAPMFDKIKDSDYAPGFDQAMKEQDSEIAAIANSAAAPTFDNTVAAMERSGRMLDRVSNTFFGDHPYAHPINGTVTTVSHIGRADVRAFAQGHWVRNGLKIAVSGDADPDTLKMLIGCAFEPQIWPVSALRVGESCAVVLLATALL